MIIADVDSLRSTLHRASGPDMLDEGSVRTEGGETIGQEADIRLEIEDPRPVDWHLIHQIDIGDFEIATAEAMARPVIPEWSSSMAWTDQEASDQGALDWV